MSEYLLLYPIVIMLFGIYVNNEKISLLEKKFMLIFMITMASITLIMDIQKVINKYNLIK